jgi:hypothetical protein
MPTLHRSKQTLPRAGSAGGKVSSEVRGAINQALAIARDSKGIIAGTVGALGLWLLRKPILNAGKALITPGQSPVHDESINSVAPDWSSDSE